MEKLSQEILVAKLQARVKRNSEPVKSGCWIWTGSIDRCGYSKASKPHYTGHRLSYVAFKGNVPDGCEIDHLCKRRSCVNPDHLEAVTHVTNIKRGDYTVNHRNGRKTHCKNGHEFTDENTVKEIWNGKERRKCRTCHNEGQRRRCSKRSSSPKNTVPGRRKKAKAPAT